MLLDPLVLWDPQAPLVSPVKMVPVVVVVTLAPLVPLESPVCSALRVLLERRDLLESPVLLALLELLVPVVLWDCRDSLVCLEPEETEEPPVVLELWESLAESAPLAPLEPEDLLETSVCLV